MTLSKFSFVHWLIGRPLLWRAYSSLLPIFFFLKLGYLSIPCSFVRVFNTFWIQVFCLNVSSPNSWFAFLPFYSLDNQKFLILMQFSLPIFFPPVVRTFCVLVNKSWSWPIPRSWRYLHIYFSRSFVVQCGISLSTCTF